MKRYFIHKEQIKTAGIKKMFQINLPPKAVAVTGIFVRATKLYIPDQELPKLMGNNRDCGAIQLELAGNTSFIYAQNVAISHNEPRRYAPLIKAGFNNNLSTSFQGEASELQSLKTAIDQPLVECYYADSQTGQHYPYDVLIYLELEETNHCERKPIINH